MYPEAFGAKPEAKPTPEPTVGGQVKEFFKGLAPGAIGLVESAAVGASSLLPEETEKAARESIASIAGAAKKPFEAAPGYEETVGRKFGQAVGSIAPFLGLGPLALQVGWVWLDWALVLEPGKHGSGLSKKAGWNSVAQPLLWALL